MKFKAFKVDETHHWNIPEMKETGKIYGVYLFDPEVSVRCCEITPSFECYKIESILIDNAISEDEYNMISNIILENDYFEDVSYFHCSFVNSLELETVENDWFENIDDAIEYCKGNSIF